MKYKKRKIKEEKWVWDNLKSTNIMQFGVSEAKWERDKEKKIFEGGKGPTFFPNVISL